MKGSQMHVDDVQKFKSSGIVSAGNIEALQVFRR